MTKILLIAQYFPPIGGAGVQRTLGFVQYLPAYGYQPIVLTSERRAGDRWTPEDESLLELVPDTTLVFRAKWRRTNGLYTRERSALRRQAFVEQGDLIFSKHNPKLILVTMSPFQDAAVASELARRHNVPWIADLRDPWALDEFQVYRSFLHRQRERRHMRKALSSAALIVMNTPEAKRRLISSFPEFESKATCITNGYNRKDFANNLPHARSDKFTVVHSGYFHAELGLRQRQRAAEYRFLNRTDRGVKFLSRSHFFLIRALEQWRREQPEIGSAVKVISVGSSTITDRQLIERSTVSNLFEFTGYLPHDECLKRVRTADLLFLPLHHMPNGRRATIVPGKTYEYMASGCPILAAVPDGDAKDFVNRAGTGLTCDPENAIAMLQILKEQYRAWQAKEKTTEWKKDFVYGFERRNLTEHLALKLRQVVDLDDFVSLNENRLAPRQHLRSRSAFEKSRASARHIS